MATIDTFYYVQGDTGPQLRLTFTDEDTGTATDLTGATVKMHFRTAGETTVLYSKTLYVNPGTPTLGIAIVNWATGELDYDAGTYQGEIEVTKASGQIETIYDTIKFKIREDFA
tara:strand:+ start:327 stop:668 length:342 start_codon:yes stop_codon:yes gene_type:complete